MSEHALLRYIERVYGIDMDELRALILSDTLVRCADTLGDGRFPVAPGIKGVVKNRVVVTIIA